MCSTYSSSQYQPSHDLVQSHWNYNNKSRTLIKIITKMATNHNKTREKNNSLRDPDTCRRCALGWNLFFFTLYSLIVFEMATWRIRIGWSLHGPEPETRT
jgi:hypothetical protein